MGFLHFPYFVILIELLSMNACSWDLNNIEEEDFMVENVESIGFSAIRPIEAWMMITSDKFHLQLLRSNT